jgi:hypothetical protein
VESNWVPVLMASALLVLAAVGAVAWLFRARAARRWQAALDAYAEQDLARERRWNAPKRVRSTSTRGRVSQHYRSPQT